MVDEIVISLAISHFAMINDQRLREYLP